MTDDPLATLPKYWRIRVMDHVHARAKRSDHYQLLLKAGQRDATRKWLAKAALEVIEDFKRDKWGGRVPSE